MTIRTWTDPELVERLKLVRTHNGNMAAASNSLGVGSSSFRTSIRLAKTRGLTADSKVINSEAKLRTKVAMLEKELASNRKEAETAEAIRKEIYGLAAQTPDPPRWLTKGKKNSKTHSVPMVLWSDFHWGERIDPHQVGGVNSFDRNIAKRRLKLLVEKTIDLALNHMVKPKYPGIVVCLGGDMISGAIHDELSESNDGYTQQSLLEVQEQLIAGLTLVADKFGKVFVPCVVGNHGRNTLKPRMKGRVYQSYEWNLYCQLELHFRSDKRIQFMIPGETDAYFSVLGHRFLLTHGDTLGVKGGDGIIGAIGPITRGAIKVGRSEAQIGRDFDTLLMCHWHCYIARSEANHVIVNGTLKGYDEYARLALRAPYSRPSQAMWFVDAHHGVTCQWQIYLEDKKQFNDTAAWVKWPTQEVQILPNRKATKRVLQKERAWAASPL
jgi:hypothetical protein